jgi:hypothetical protein
LKNFGFEQVSPTLLYEDSRALIVVTENPENRKASRHVDTRKHFIAQLVKDKAIILEQGGTMVEEIQYYHGPGISYIFMFQARQKKREGQIP